jgi:hypothetical protein
MFRPACEDMMQNNPRFKNKTLNNQTSEKHCKHRFKNRRFAE